MIPLKTLVEMKNQLSYNLGKVIGVQQWAKESQMTKQDMSKALGEVATDLHAMVGHLTQIISDHLI